MNNGNQPNIVPFGKYKGQPIEVLAQDPQYVEWMVGQGWFKDKYPQFYTVIINNFQEPSDTPEHNALQAMFLDDELCLKLSSRSYPTTAREKLMLNRIHSKQFEVDGIDIIITYYSWAYGEYSGVRNGRYQTWNEWHPDHYQVAVEVKPSIGDDFPAILRQASRMFGVRGRDIDSVCVVFRDFVATSVRLEQVRAMFNASSVLLFSLDEIQQTPIRIYPEKPELSND